MADLFISYARSDATEVEALAELLERTGWSVWWDRRITTGSSFDLVIEEALAEAKAVIVAWSKDSVGSEWVRAEAAFAIEKKKLIPVRLDGSVPPLRFTNVQTVDLAGWDRKGASDSFQRLIADLTQLIGPPPAAEERARAAAAAAAAKLSRTPRAEPPASAAASPRKAAGGRRGVALAVAAVVVLAAAGAVFVLKSRNERGPAKPEESASLARQAAPPSAPVKSAAPASVPEQAATPTTAQPAASTAPSAASAPAKATAPEVADREIELAFWKSIKDSTIAADFQAYLDKYPNGDFAAVARNHLAALSAAPPAPAPAAASPTPPPAAAAPPAKAGPELDVIDDFMIAARAAPLREAPDIVAKQIGRLKDGERVRVAGKVKGSEWYAVTLKGDTLAYVASVALEDVATYEARKEKEQAREKAQQAAAVVVKPPAVAAPAAPPRATGVAAYNGTWRGIMSCGPSANGPAFESRARPFTVADGHMSADVDVPGYGTGGHETYSGKVDADGSFNVSGSGRNGKVGNYFFEFSGKISGDSLDGNGRMGPRHCTLSYRR